MLPICTNFTQNKFIQMLKMSVIGANFFNYFNISNVKSSK